MMSDTLYHSVIFHTAFISIAVSVIVVIRNYYGTKKIMKSLDDMLSQAADGTFTAKRIDESMLSALEFKLSHFLSASAISASRTAVEKDKLKTLISDISHQTKTPIASLLLYSELLKEQDLNEMSRDYADALNAQAQKLNFLIASLVKMSRLETGILTLHPRITSVTPMLSTIKEHYAPKAMEKGLTLTLIPAPENADIHAVFDEKWTLEALGNIVDNAIKYTERGGITIKATAFLMFCRIEIMDTGIGISETEQAQIFTRFYRSPQVMEKEGVGIGLYLAREIISSEGGYIKLSSKTGRGSNFAIYLQTNETAN